jgi:hypothetical protein
VFGAVHRQMKTGGNGNRLASSTIAVWKDVSNVPRKIASRRAYYKRRITIVLIRDSE